jgi:hypothetical protein
MRDGRYERRQLLGDGGMGQVWRGVDTLLGRDVALKMPLQRLALDPLFAERFQREARAMASVKHTNVIDIYDVCDSPDGPFIVMEYVSGGSLADLLQRRGRLGADETMHIVAQAARALAAAHRRGVVHRDVKPGNLLLRDDGDPAVVLTDFGIAHTPTADLITGTGQNIGTATHMAPELFDGGPATPRSDIYAIGVVAYECLAGHPPFQADSVVAVATMHVMREPAPLPPDVPPAVRRVIARAMAKDPEQRYASAEELAAAIETPARPVRRGPRRWLVAAAALAVLGGAGGLIVRAYGGDHAGSSSDLPADLRAFAAGWPVDDCRQDGEAGENQQERWRCPVDATTRLYLIRYLPGGHRDARRTENDKMKPKAGTIELERGSATAPGGAPGLYREYEVNVGTAEKPDWNDQIWFDNYPVESPPLALILRTTRTPDSQQALTRLRRLWQSAGYSRPT